MEIRKASDKDVLQIGELFQHCFSKELSQELWYWKYRNAPWGAVSYVAIDNGKLISHYGAVRYIFLKSGYPLTSYQFCDVMTHSAYRGKVFGKSPPVVRAGQMLYTDNYMDFAFGFPSKRHARLQALMFKGSSYKETITLKKNLSKLNNTPLLSINEGWHTLKPSEIDMLWNKSKTSYSLTINKEKAYLLWRYKEIPQRAYSAISIRNTFTGTLKALAFMSYKEKEANLLDIIVINKKLYQHCLDLIEDYLFKKEFLFLNIWLNSATKYIVTSDYKENDGIPFAFRPVNEKLLNAEEFFSLYDFRMGDYDDV
ncbi:MAG: GNAT family N-acetyltransferase [Candidatus Magnetoovum sp. WYHC-5]|nr:GNAT family N-acetyltransferase [Candidatus Magnetoovum sp. WYHC-5]